MSQHIVPRLAYALLFAGAALVWIWEFALAIFGDRNPVIWALIAAGCTLILLSYVYLVRSSRR
jgi:hypothetical protein